MHINGKGIFGDCRRVVKDIDGGLWRSKEGSCFHFVKMARPISSLGLWVGYRWKARMACCVQNQLCAVQKGMKDCRWSY